jgi:hypothetical protein
VDPQTLFDFFYADNVRKAYQEKQLKEAGSKEKEGSSKKTKKFW